MYEATGTRLDPYHLERGFPLVHRGSYYTTSVGYHQVAQVNHSPEHTVRALRIEDRGYDDGGSPSLPLLSLRNFVSGHRRTCVVTIRKYGTAVVDGEDVVL
jgi:hypothetical protein